jgi:hypothetical protein
MRPGKKVLPDSCSAAKFHGVLTEQAFLPSILGVLTEHPRRSYRAMVTWKVNGLKVEFV